MLLDLFQVVGEDIETNFLFLCRHIAPKCRCSGLRGTKTFYARTCSFLRGLPLSAMISPIYQLELYLSTYDYEVLKQRIGHEKHIESLEKSKKETIPDLNIPEPSIIFFHNGLLFGAQNQKNQTADPNPPIIFSHRSLPCAYVCFWFHLLICLFSWGLLKVLPNNFLSNTTGGPI